MTLIELKAKAYDALALIESGQRILADINKQIANYREPPLSATDIATPVDLKSE